jgi:hypothetical protein
MTEINAIVVNHPYWVFFFVFIFINIYPCYYFLRRINKGTEDAEKLTLENYVGKMNRSIKYLIGTIIIFCSISVVIEISSLLLQTAPQTPFDYDITPFLKLLAALLLTSKALEMGFALFIEGTEKAIDPVITCIPACILMTISNKSMELYHYIGVGILVLSMALLLWIKSNVLHKK